MREMKDSGVEWIGKIPKDWEIVPLTKQLDSIVDYRGKTPEKTEEGIFLVTAKNIKDGKICYELSKEYVREADYEEIMHRGIPQIGDILFTTEAPLGQVANVDRTDIALAQRIIKFRALSTVNNYYLKYWMLNEGFQQFLHSLSTGSTATGIKSSKLFLLPLVRPNIEQQNKIVEYLDAKCSKIDEIVEKQKVIIEKLEEYKLSIITEAVIKGLNPDVEMKNSGYEYIGDIPNYWNVCRLRNYGSAQNGISKGGEYFGTGFPFVSYGDVYRNYALPNRVDGLINTTEEERKKYSVEEGDIFFTRTSETIEEVGFSAVCNKTIPNATYAGFVIRVRPFIDMLTLGFAKYYFRSKHLRVYFAKEMNLVTRASLGQDLLKSMPLLVPPKDEQCKIAEYLDKKCNLIDSNIYEKGRLIIKLQEYKKSLIYEVVTGKKEV